MKFPLPAKRVSPASCPQEFPSRCGLITCNAELGVSAPFTVASGPTRLRGVSPRSFATWGFPQDNRDSRVRTGSLWERGTREARPVKAGAVG